MLIAIDGNEANVRNRVGSNVYAFQMLKHLYQCQMSNVRCQNYNSNVKIEKFRIHLKDEPLTDLPLENKWWKYKVVKPKKLWTQIALPLNLYFHKPQPDVFFSPGHYAPHFCPVPLVISVLDVSYLMFPGQFRKQDLWQLKNWTKTSINSASKIITISRATKNDIIRYYNIRDEKIKVIYPGIKGNEKFKMKNSKLQFKIQKLKKKFGINDDYIIYVGTLQPRKNLIRLIKAFNQSIKVSKHQSIKLVIVGKKGWMYDEIFKEVKELELENKVIFTDYVPEEELPYLIKGALCLVLVSLYEGFGLPVAEAMALGVPVIVSNVSSLPEIVGNAGIFVNPYDLNDITNAIKKIIDIHTTEYGKYKQLVEKGLKQAKKFSWEKCARETLKVLKETATKT